MEEKKIMSMFFFLFFFTILPTYMVDFNDPRGCFVEHTELDSCRKGKAFQQIWGLN